MNNSILIFYDQNSQAFVCITLINTLIWDVYYVGIPIPICLAKSSAAFGPEMQTSHLNLPRPYATIVPASSTVPYANQWSGRGSQTTGRASSLHEYKSPGPHDFGISFSLAV